MDVTFVLEESGATATVEVPCDSNAAAAKEAGCAALAVLPASVEMRIGTEVVEGTCSLQDTAIGSGVQVVLSHVEMRCPAEYGTQGEACNLALSHCGTLCLYSWGDNGARLCGFDTGTFDKAFSCRVGAAVNCTPAISRCKTRCYLLGRACFREVLLPSGGVFRTISGISKAVFARGNVVVSQGENCVTVYDADEDLTKTHSFPHESCTNVAVSDCGGWVISSSHTDTRLWDASTGGNLACVPGGGCVAVSRSASVFARGSGTVRLYDAGGAVLRSTELAIIRMQFTPCGKYLVFLVFSSANPLRLHQYDVATMSCVRIFDDVTGWTFAISPCSRAIVYAATTDRTIMTRHLFPHSE